MSDTLQAKLAELGRRFAAQAPEQGAALRAALDTGDTATLGITAHKLGGIAAMFGHPEIGEAALAVEDAVDAGADPREATERLLELLAAL